MDLFDQLAGEPHNLLSKDGIVNYYGELMPTPEADYFLNELMSTISWQHDVAIIYGKAITTKRKIAWHGDKPFQYTYSNTVKIAQPWTPVLIELKNRVEQKTGESFNACLLNLYHNGEEGMTWHSDAEKELKKNGAIASLSFGAARKFSFKHKVSQETTSVTLAHGSLLVMKGTTQSHWLHCLPTSKKITGARINLTFRTIANATS